MWKMVRKSQGKVMERVSEFLVLFFWLPWIGEFEVVYFLFRYYSDLLA